MKTCTPIVLSIKLKTMYFRVFASIILQWLIYLIFGVLMPLSAIFQLSWQSVLVVEEAGVPAEKPPTMGKQLVNFITCGCESSAPFFVIYKAGCKPKPYW